MKRTAFVLGGAGFLGRYACAALNAGGWDTVVLSRRELPGALCTTLAADDLTDLLCRERPDLVVNAAGMVWHSPIDPAEPVNTTLPAVLAEAAVKADVPRLLHLGSAHEYGPAEHGAVMHEDFPVEPRTPYGISKLAGSVALLDVADRTGLDAAVLRVFNAIGPGMTDASLLGMVVARLAAGAATIELGEPTQHRDFIDARDVATAVAMAAEAQPGTFAGGAVANIGSGRAVDTADITARLIEESGRAAEIVTHRRDDGTRTWRLDWQCAGITAAQRLFGWRPTTDVTTTTVRDIWAHTLEGESA